MLTPFVLPFRLMSEGQPCPGPASGWPCRTFPARRFRVMRRTPSRLYSGLSCDTGPEPGESEGTRVRAPDRAVSAQGIGKWCYVPPGCEWLALRGGNHGTDCGAELTPVPAIPSRALPFTSRYLWGDPRVLGYSAEGPGFLPPSLWSACRHRSRRLPCSLGKCAIQSQQPRLLSCFILPLKFSHIRQKQRKVQRTSCGHSYFHASLLCLDPLRLLRISFHLHIFYTYF